MYRMNKILQIIIAFIYLGIVVQICFIEHHSLFVYVCLNLTGGG